MIHYINKKKIYIKISMKYFTSSKLLAVAAILTIGQIVSLTDNTSNDIPSAILEAMKDKDPETFFRAYIIAFRKEYTFESELGQKRFKTFIKSLENIKKYNQKHGDSTKFGVTPLSDISEEEYYHSIQERNTIENEFESVEITPVSQNEKFEPIDWRTSIPFIKRPGWSQDGAQEISFQVLFAYEAANCIATKNYTALSGPQVMNCLNLNQPFTYLNDNGLYSEKDYPTPVKWSNIRSKCEDSNKTGKTYKISATSSTNLNGRPESRLIRRSSRDLYSYLKRGPVMVRFSSSWDLFNKYKGGIFTSDEPCSDCERCSRYNKGLLVGYGIDSKTNQDYWIIKFHKGEQWGENGSYMRLARNEAALNYGLACFWRQPVG